MGQPVSPENNISIVPEPRSNSLMVAATPQNMPEIADLITKLDQSTIQMKFYPMQLKYIKAAEAQQMIQAFLTNRQQKLGNAAPLFDIVADTRTNSLLISASPSDIEQIEALIKLIDVEPSPEVGSAVKMAIFRLEKAVASDVVTHADQHAQLGQSAAAAQEQIRRLQLEIQGPRGRARAERRSISRSRSRCWPTRGPTR